MIPEDFKFEEGQVFELTKDGETERAKAEYDEKGSLFVRFIKKDVFIYLLAKDGTTVSNAVYYLNKQDVNFVSQQDYITITDMETPIEPDFDQQIINAKLEFADKMLFNSDETNLAALQVNKTLKKILSIEKQRKMYNAEQLWNRLRDQVVSDEDENDDEKFYDMIQDLELYYETKLKPITNTPKEFTSNDGC